MWRRVAQSLATFALLLLCPAIAHAQKTRVYDFCSIGGQKVITQGLTQSSPPAVMGSYGTTPISPPCTIIVYETGTLTKATIFSDQAGDSLANPFSSTNNTSYWFFYGTPGDRVDVTISGGGLPSPFTFTDILIGGAAPTSLLIQTNGVTNLSQTSLNLVAGSNVTLTNVVGGSVRIDATGGGGTVVPCSTLAAGVKAITPQTCAGEWTLQGVTGNPDVVNLTLSPSTDQEAPNLLSTNVPSASVIPCSGNTCGSFQNVAAGIRFGASAFGVFQNAFHIFAVKNGNAQGDATWGNYSAATLDYAEDNSGSPFYSHVCQGVFTGSGTPFTVQPCRAEVYNGGTGGVSVMDAVSAVAVNSNLGGTVNLMAGLYAIAGSNLSLKANVTYNTGIWSEDQHNVGTNNYEYADAADALTPGDFIDADGNFLNQGVARIGGNPTRGGSGTPIGIGGPKVWTSGLFTQETMSVPQVVWTAGSGAPSSSCGTGSIYVRTDGTSNATVYRCEASAWVAVTTGVTTTGSPANTYLAGFTGAGSISGSANATLDSSGNVVVASLTDTGLTAGRCVQTTTGGLLTIAAAACGTSSGTITATGTPASGNLTKFSGATSITNGDLSGDVTTSGTLAATVVALRGLALPTLAASTGFLYDNAGTLALTTSASNLTTGTLPAAQLPNPTASTLGGIESFASVSHQWINAISTSGVPSATRPAAADLSDTATAGNYLRGNGTSFVSAAIQAADVPTLNQNTTGVAANLSGTPALPNGTTATTQSTADTTIKLATDAFVHNNLPAFQVNGTPNGSQSLLNLAAGSNITITDGGSGTITIAATGGGGSTSPGGAFNTVQYNASGGFGGVTLNSTTTKEYLSQTSSGAPSFAQVAAADISGLAASATTDTTNASNISSGTLAHALLPPLVSGDIPNNAANTTGTAANLSGTPTLPNGTAATTQAASDNSTKLATTAYVTTGISNAIAGVNPAVAVQAATAAILPNSPTYSNGVSGIGATLTAGSTNVTLIVDGYTPVLNDRILVQNQASAFQNGVYTATQLAAVGLPWVLTRALDYDQPSDMNNTGAIPVVNGTANASTSWVLTSKVTTVGTDALTFTQFSLAPSSIVTQTLNATNGQICTYAGANKVCVPASALPNGITATTQTALDNSTKVATTAYTDSAVAAANPMTTIGDRIGGGASGAETRVAAGLTGQIDTAVNGGTGGFTSPGVAGRSVSGTTDTILGDSGTTLRDRVTTIQYTSASAIAVTLSQAGSSGFSNNFAYSSFVTGAGTATITPTTSTINGQTSLAQIQNVWCSISSPDNTNYLARCANYIKAGSGLTPTFNADGSTTLTLSTALPNLTTATTQAAKDNSTNVATTAYVDRPTGLTTGTSVTLTAPRQYFVCTGACTITVPVPAAGYEFCVMNDDNVTTVITMAAIGSSARYENTARTAYGTAGTGTFVSGGAAGDKVCLLGRDSTHYLTVSYNGSWTAN